MLTLNYSVHLMFFFIHIILRRLSYKYMQFTQQHLYYICIFVCTLLDLCVLINMILCRLQYKFMCATLLILFTASYVLFLIDLILCTLSYKSMWVTWDYHIYILLLTSPYLCILSYVHYLMYILLYTLSYVHYPISLCGLRRIILCTFCY